MDGYCIGAWFASIVAGTLIASQRKNAMGGFALCFFLGPIGLFACPFIDARVRCPQCGTHLNEAPNQCPSCWARFRRNEPTKHSEPE